MTIWRMRIACWIIKATDTLSEHIILVLIAFPQQQWLHERALLLRYTYNVFLFFQRLDLVERTKSAYGQKM